MVEVPLFLDQPEGEQVYEEWLTVRPMTEAEVEENELEGEGWSMIIYSGKMWRN